MRCNALLPRLTLPLSLPPFGPSLSALAGPDASALGETRQLCYMAFDILKLGDKALIDKPLNERRGGMRDRECTHARVCDARMTRSRSPGLTLWTPLVLAAQLSCTTS